MTWAEFVQYVNQYLQDNDIEQDCLLEYIDLGQYVDAKRIDIQFDDERGLLIQS